MKDKSLAGWTIVFDLDGTLVDTAPDLHAALNHCLTGADLDAVPFETIETMIGEGAKAMIRKALAVQSIELGENEVEGLWTQFIDYYRANICRLSQPYPKSEETLLALRAREATCAICTNKNQQLADELVSRLGLDKHFAAIVGADSVPNKKPDGDHILRTVRAAGGSPERAIMIGDSQTDERAALNAGLPFIFVPFGYGPDPAARASELDIANSYTDIMPVIDGITLRQPLLRRR